MLKLEFLEEALAVTPEEASFGATALGASLATVTAPEMLPADCGTNSSSTLTLCPAATVTEELLPTTENPVPETVRPEIVRDAVPVSVSVMVWVALVPTGTLPKSMEAVLAERIPEPEVVVVAADVLLAALVV